MNKSSFFSNFIAGLTLCSLCLCGCKSDAQPTSKVKTNLYTIHSKALSLTKGTEKDATFRIKLVKGAKIHPKAPFKCNVSASKGLSLTKKKLGHQDTKTSKDKRDVQVPVRVKAQKEGAQNVNMDCSFFVCTKDICSRHEEKVSIQTSVKALK